MLIANHRIASSLYVHLSYEPGDCTTGVVHAGHETQFHKFHMGSALHVWHLHAAMFYLLIPTVCHIGQDTCGVAFVMGVYSLYLISMQQY